MTLSSWILNERIQERKKQTYIIRGGYLGSRMSLCNNSNEIITKSNIFRTEIAGTEVSSPKIFPHQNTQLPNCFNRNDFEKCSKEKKWSVFCMNVPTQLLSKCEEETLAHLRCPQFCFACNLRVYHRESLLAGTFACTFLLVRRHPAGSSVENKFTFGKRFLSFLVSLIWISVTLQIRPWERRDKIDFGDIICKYIQQSKGTT